MKPQGSEQMTRCSLCGAGVLHEGEHVLSAEVAGRTFERAVPALLCASCNEGVISSVDLGAFEVAVAGELLATGPRTVEAARYVRKALGLTAAELGYGREEVVAWETGAAPAPAGLWAQLEAAHLEQQGATPIRATGTGGE